MYINTNLLVEHVLWEADRVYKYEPFGRTCSMCEHYNRLSFTYCQSVYLYLDISELGVVTLSLCKI